MSHTTIPCLYLTHALTPSPTLKFNMTKDFWKTLFDVVIILGLITGFLKGLRGK